ncbi:BTB/POZ domain containing protein [Naviculisporaceae sp. PSN 640]
MTHLLWKYYWQDDVESFRRLLSPGGGSNAAGKSPNVGGPGFSHIAGSSPGGFGTSPRPPSGNYKPRKPSALGTPLGNKHGNAGGLGKNEVNSRDHAGLTLLLRAASSTAENAISFVEALLEHPAIDIYVQDPESGWNSLHRALYAGNISIARLLLEKERKDSMGYTASGRVGQLIKTKDHEGNSPFDLYNSTIAERDLRALNDDEEQDGAGSDSDDTESVKTDVNLTSAGLRALGEDLFAFGSNRNMSLGFGDEDDRQFPERVYLKRPEHLLVRFYNEYLEEVGLQGPASNDLSRIPALILNRPLLIRDVVLAKFHSAVLTEDPVSNLYVCGIGRGGRLGLGDENTRFTYTAVQGPLADKKIIQIALGQNHSMAIDDTGALWTWGNNAHCQLGYALPAPTKKDEDPISTTPRQVFGSLKKEVILGVAASSIHSVAHTGSSLYCWGKNVGQLALMDADSRSLELQQTPRKVAASLFPAPIVMVSAIDKATTVLLQNHTVYVLTGYGYHNVKFPFAGIGAIGNLSMSTRYEPGRNRIQYITSGGETIAALTGRGDLFTMNLDHKIETNPPATSTTNPSKLKGAVTPPQCIWSARKDGVRSIGVGEHGSVIFSTFSGAVWRRIKRTKKAKDTYSALGESKLKDFKFQRVPYITKVATVRASPSGAFAAVRQDLDVLKVQLGIEEQGLWRDVKALNCLKDFEATRSTNVETSRFWDDEALRTRIGPVACEVLRSADLEGDLRGYLSTWGYRNEPLDVAVCTSSEPEIKVPVHGWLLAARSSVLRSGLALFRKNGEYALPETFDIEGTADGKLLVTFHGLDIISLLNLVHYMYEDEVIPAWNFTRQAQQLAYRYRQIRLEVMRLGTRLKMNNLEAAARLQTVSKKCMDEDFRVALKDPGYFDDGDALLVLDDGVEVPVHSSFICQRCPWFEGLFHGRSGGSWLAGRRGTMGTGSEEKERVKIDLEHMDPGAFKYVLRFLYGDYGAELFDSAVCDSFDDFLDLVMEVMSIANYLMLDRLSQICQTVMGRFANIRNVAHLLNAISPCSITEFKDAGLEYVCLQLESMLENHLLDELDEELLLELDEVVRDNQASRFPFARSGRAEGLLHEANPELAEDIHEERRIRVKEMAWKARMLEEDRKGSVSAKGKGVLLSPDLKKKVSQGDLMFDMDEEEDDEDGSSPLVNSPSLRPRKSPAPVSSAAELDHIPELGSSWKGTPRGKVSFGGESSTPVSPATRTPIHLGVGTPGKVHSGLGISPELNKDGSPWRQTTLSTPKLDLKDIIQSESTAGSGSRSALSDGLAAQKTKDGSGGAPRLAQPKMSQKERKRHQQQQQELATQAALLAAAPKTAWEKSPGDKSAPAPWKIAAGKSKAKPVPTESSPASASQSKNHLLPGEAATSSIPIHRRTASPDTRFSGQQRTPVSSTSTGTPKPSTSTSKPVAESPSTSNKNENKPLVPHSKNYITPAKKEDAFAGYYGMADIIAQERREQEMVREAARAKRSLQEIQQEQAFQEWWDAESKRMQAEEEEKERRKAALTSGAGSNSNNAANGAPRGRAGRRGGNKGEGSNRPKGEGAASAAAGGPGGNGKRGGRGGQGQNKGPKENGSGSGGAGRNETPRGGGNKDGVPPQAPAGPSNKPKGGGRGNRGGNKRDGQAATPTGGPSGHGHNHGGRRVDAKPGAAPATAT